MQLKGWRLCICTLSGSLALPPPLVCSPSSCDLPAQHSLPCPSSPPTSGEHCDRSDLSGRCTFSTADRVVRALWADTWFNNAKPPVVCKDGKRTCQSQQDFAYDISLIRLEEPVGNTYGWLGLGECRRAGWAPRRTQHVLQCKWRLWPAGADAHIGLGTHHGCLPACQPACPMRCPAALRTPLDCVPRIRHGAALLASGSGLTILPPLPTYRLLLQSTRAGAWRCK